MSLEQIISKVEVEILNPLIYFLMALATVIFIWGVIEFMANAGSEEAQTKGKQHIIWGILGLAIMMGTFGIINILASVFR